MKGVFQKVSAILSKPIFLLSIVLWFCIAIHVGFHLLAGRVIGESSSIEVERNGTEMLVDVLGLVLSVAFIRLSWQGLCHWPGKYPKFRFEAKGASPIDADRRITRPSGDEA
ncbi:hypothetical protein [Coraliomargarita parva]|uniref:hypothetical protein n=1 Tax=Coraliomargarita parva TaxID=3014050 RepID=UPI0022B3BF77|nr:hypothetical protein [Coraliomargarita parva]